MKAKAICRSFGLFTSILFVLASMTASAQSREPLSPFLIMDKTEVNPKILKSFEQKFEDATALSWYQTKETNVLVKYSQNNQVQYALFTAKGVFIRQFTYGTEQNLPQVVKNIFTDKYWNTTVVNVANVKENFRDIWIVFAQKDEHSFSVKIEDGEIEEL